ncbi:MAG: dTDP-4-dehydrorhamnose reductase [Chloroflexi bacterium]|nr:dTDP-4-dehydrorhamnose reductase [Chloroflexota bacterium]MCL5075073.1 dTDP-4-dehydrorhamnose reductase [Chloroflexota bacterium]
MRIFITGSRGQLGVDLQKVLETQTLGLADLPDLDITDYEATLRAIEEFAPDVIIHAAALTNVDGCELDPDTAYRVNGLGTQSVALAAHQVGAAMVYISTDYVFDGKKGEPYLEFDEPNPINMYGKSKLAGERYVQMLLDRFYIVRTAWLYSATGRNFVKTIMHLAEQQEEILAVTDESGSPTYARDLALALAKLIERPLYGLYHLTNEGRCSRYEYISKILGLIKKKVRLVPMTTAEYIKKYPLPAARPTCSELRNFCAATALGITMRPWEEALEDFLCSPL